MFNIMNFIYILFFDWKNDELNNIKVICGVLTLFLFMLGWIPSIIFVSKIKNTIISSIKEENNTKSNLPSK